MFAEDVYNYLYLMNLEELNKKKHNLEEIKNAKSK